MPIFTTIVQSAFSQERLGEVTAGTQLFRNIGGTVSTAVLGGVMSSQLVSRLTNVSSEPFIVAMKQVNHAADFTKIDVNTIQGFLSAEGQSQIKTMIANAPQAIQSQLLTSFSHFLNTIKTALSYAVDHMFIVSTILMFVGLVLVIFLPQIPLRKGKHSALEEAELEMGNELGAQVDSQHEPEA
jgi:ABC-type multidrug transport system fused ATPase/permease subunit